MSCLALVDRDKHGKEKLVGFLCGCELVYEFEGFRFEWHSYHGPYQVRRDTGEVRTTVAKGFWTAMDRFQKLSDEEKQKHLYEGR